MKRGVDVVYQGTLRAHTASLNRGARYVVSTRGRHRLEWRARGHTPKDAFPSLGEDTAHLLSRDLPAERFADRIGQATDGETIGMHIARNGRVPDVDIDQREPLACEE